MSNPEAGIPARRQPAKTTRCVGRSPPHLAGALRRLAPGEPAPGRVQMIAAVHAPDDAASTCQRGAKTPRPCGSRKVNLPGGILSRWSGRAATLPRRPDHGCGGRGRGDMLGPMKRRRAFPSASGRRERPRARGYGRGTCLLRPRRHRVVGGGPAGALRRRRGSVCQHVVERTDIDVLRRPEPRIVLCAAVTAGEADPLAAMELEPCALPSQASTGGCCGDGCRGDACTGYRPRAAHQACSLRVASSSPSGPSSRRCSSRYR